LIIMRPDGTERVLDTLGDAITDEKGNVARLVGTCRDVTDSVARDERLQFFADVFQHAEIGLSAWRLDQTAPVPQLRLVACNQAMEQLCGTQMSYRLGATLAELIPEAATTGLIDMARGIAAGGPVQKPPPFRRNGVDRSPVLAPTLFALSDHMVGLALEDVTERVLTEDEAIRKKLDDMAQTTDDVLVTVRRISADLRPGVLDTLGLRAAVEWQAEEFQKRTGMKVTVSTDITDLQLDRDLSTNMFRIFQEALTNIARHSAAANVDVAMKLERGQLRLEISDDGIGLPEIAPRGSSLGLLGMRERARRLGGECTVKRRQPRGTTVTVTVPLRFPAERTGSF
jgi:two-component sensor histidine kinase